MRYDTWIDLLVDLVEAEHDHRPLVLLGASIGGLLAYEVAARSPHVAAVAATCLLDPGDWRARTHMTRAAALGVLGGPLSALARGGLERTMVPMNAVANLRRMSRDRALSRLCAIDPRGGAARVPLGFLASYLRFAHTPPERNRTPVTLLHPGRDAWTPIELSARVLSRAAGPAISQSKTPESRISSTPSPAWLGVSTREVGPEAAAGARATEVTPWWTRPDSNRRPTRCKRVALPTELQVQVQTSPRLPVPAHATDGASRLSRRRLYRLRRESHQSSPPPAAQYAGRPLERLSALGWRP